MSAEEGFASYPSLRDRAVLVTGGGSGIGASVVEHFARQGSRVAFIDVADEPSQALIESLAPEVRHAPLYVHCDLTDIAALRVAIAEIEAELGPLQVLVNNASNDDRHEFGAITPEYWDERMAVNLRHQFFTIQAVVPGMSVAGGGSIINLSSIGWLIPSTGMVAYVTAKAGIVGLTRTMAHELGVANIRVNCVMPGWILTERQRRLWLNDESLKETLKVQALKRELMPAEVARLILFLASDDSSAITNQSYAVDGGWI